jgi:hypothetical protein
MNTQSRSLVVLLQQVLDAYRSPSHYNTLWADPEYRLPTGVTDLLDLALASPEVLAASSSQFNTNSEELVAAIHFFIQQVLLAEDSNAYRILGVAPSATAAQIKSHYRKLMSLYHPDRIQNSNGCQVYAQRINQAYRSLYRLDGWISVKDMMQVKPRTFSKQYSCFQLSSSAYVDQGQVKPAFAVSGLSSWRKIGLTASGIAVIVGVSFIVWNLLMWFVWTTPIQVPKIVPLSPIKPMFSPIVERLPLALPKLTEDIDTEDVLNEQSIPNGIKLPPNRISHRLHHHSHHFFNKRHQRRYFFR